MAAPATSHMNLGGVQRGFTVTERSQPFLVSAAFFPFCRFGPESPFRERAKRALVILL